MAYRRKRTREYQRARKDLRLSARLLLRELEERIAENPELGPPDDTPNSFRAQVVLRGRLVTVECDPSDLLIFFRVQPPDVVWFDLIVDLRDPPDWFLQPTGTWAEQLLGHGRDVMN